MDLFSDFTSLWAAGALLHSSGDPYHEENYSHVLQQAGISLTEVPGGFHNPPNSLILFWLIACVPLPWAILLNILLSAVSFLKGILLDTPRVRRMPLPSLLMFLILFVPFSKGLIVGQITSYLFFVQKLAQRYEKKGNSMLSGVVLSILFIKPHFTAPFILHAGISSSKRKLFLMGLGTGLLIQSVLSFVVAPSGFISYFSYFSSFTEARALILQPNLPHLAVFFGLSWGIAKYISVIMLGALCVAILFLPLRKRLSSQEVFALSLIGAPYSWAHDQIFLAPTFLKDWGAFSVKGVTNFLLLLIVLIAMGIDIKHLEVLSLLLPVYTLAKLRYERSKSDSSSHTEQNVID